MYQSDDSPAQPTDAINSAILTPEVRRYLWARWDASFANYRVKLKWGFFRPSFKIGAIVEPILVKYIGPRPA